MGVYRDNGMDIYIGLVIIIGKNSVAIYLGHDRFPCTGGWLSFHFTAASHQPSGSCNIWELHKTATDPTGFALVFGSSRSAT